MLTPLHYFTMGQFGSVVFLVFRILVKNSYVFATYATFYMQLTHREWTVGSIILDCSSIAATTVLLCRVDLAKEW
jgi:hypothetical protein